uniref:Uncharacterized protein n=1 Tax=Timema monikensis TaxID=170555 RepID=A0A7R9EDK3_9NEOP|nr:unnamed protein product [Timema monikensis]
MVPADNVGHIGYHSLYEVVRQPQTFSVLRYLRRLLGKSLEEADLRLEEDTSLNIGHDMEKEEFLDPTTIDHISDHRCSFQPIHNVSRKKIEVLEFYSWISLLEPRAMAVGGRMNIGSSVTRLCPAHPSPLQLLSQTSPTTPAPTNHRHGEHATPLWLTPVVATCRLYLHISLSMVSKSFQTEGDPGDRGAGERMPVTGLRTLVTSCLAQTGGGGSVGKIKKHWQVYRRPIITQSPSALQIPSSVKCSNWSRLLGSTGCTTTPSVMGSSSNKEEENTFLFLNTVASSNDLHGTLQGGEIPGERLSVSRPQLEINVHTPTGVSHSGVACSP